MKEKKRWLAIIIVITLLVGVIVNIGNPLFANKSNEGEEVAVTESVTEESTEADVVVSEEDVPEEETTTEEMISTEETQEQPEALSYEDDQVVVAVASTDEYQIPEGYTLKVTPILKDSEETKDQYAQVEQKLQEKSDETEGTDIVGFLAYDIKLVDVEGNEVEPDGNVKVSMDYKEAVMPEGMDEETAKDTDVTVMHLEEDENGEVVNVVDLSQVADETTASDETKNNIETMEVTDSNEIQKTEFVTGGFSTYTITWVQILANNPTSTVSITNDILNDGSFTATLNDTQVEVTSYAWASSDSQNGTFSPIEKVDFEGGSSNISTDGTKLYPAFDSGARKWYKVQATLSSGAVIESVAMQVPYFDELQNGSFEIPKYTDRATNQPSNSQYKNAGGVWQTTGTGSGIHNGKDIEIINTNKNFKGSYSWHGNDGARDGSQFAELNCEASGALYQDVLTIPGTSLNYWFAHRARGRNSGITEFDTMYLIIMPTSVAMTSGSGNQELKTQDELVKFIKDTTNVDITKKETLNAEKEEKIYDNNGIYILKAVSDDLNWHDISKLSEYVSTSSLTRFFFVAGQTASNDNTIGNFIDRVGFSQKLPPVNEDEFTLQIEKKFVGLDNATLNEMKNNISFKITAKNKKTGHALTTYELNSLFGKSVITGNEMSQQADGSLVYFISNKKIANEQYEVTIEEQNAKLAGYELTTTNKVTVNIDNSSTTSDGTVINPLKGKMTAKVSFTNTYSRSETKKVNFTKVWDDNNNAFKTRPESLNVTLKASITVADGNGNQTVELGNLTRTATLTQANGWKTTWENVPVYYNYNGVDVKVNYTVEEEAIDSAFEYIANPIATGDGANYSFSNFSNVTTQSDSEPQTDEAPQTTGNVPAKSRLLSLFAIPNNTNPVNTYGVNPLADGNSTTSDLGEPAHTKYIDYNEATADYTLNLDVTGKKGTAQGADILFVIDTSGSMGTNSWGGTDSTYNNLLPTLKTLLTQNNGIIDKIFATEGNVNSVAFVSFAGKSETKTSSWYGTSQKQTLKNGINNLSAKGGTNWTYAMQQAGSLMAQRSNSENEKVVVFLSDGKPTYTMKNGVQSGNGSDTNNSYYTDAVNAVKNSTLQNATFYSVYLTNGTKEGMKKFDDNLTNTTHELVDGTTLTTALEAILNKIIPTYKNVVITDTLSENVDFVETNPTITVKKKTSAGIETVLGTNEYIATVTGKQISVRLLNGASLEDGATYTMSFKVKPSEKANEKFVNGGYTNTGDANTGVTSAGKRGFYSNDKNSTTVSYEIDGVSGTKTATYPMPVVQVTTHVLSYEKQWNVPNGVTAPTNDVVLHVTYTDATQKDITLKSEQGYKYTEQTLITKKIQTVSEDVIDGYTASYEISEAGDSVVVTNSYSKVTTSAIEAKKVWIGNGPKSSINVSLYKTSTEDGTTSLVETKELNTANNWTYSWTNLVLTERIGTELVHYTYAVREENIPAGYSSNITNTVEDDKTVVTITNTYDPNCADENYYISNVLQTEEIVIAKQWDDNENRLNVRPDNLPITVSGNRNLTFYLNSNNNWEKTVTLVKMKNSTYTAEENLESDAYEQQSKTVAGNKTTFVNKLKTISVTVQKEWNDGNISDRPTSVQFKLESSVDNGKTWNLYDEYSITNEDTDWTTTITDLPAFYQYRVVEQNVANGYIQKVTGENNSYVITNTLKWSIRKTNEVLEGQTVNALAGAKFELKKAGTVIATGTSGEDGIIAWTANNDINMNELDGEYQLHETKAPEGYLVSDSDWMLTFNNGLLTKLNNVELIGTKDNGVSVDVTNKVLYELPATGGIGTYLFTIGGVAVLMTAFLLFIKNKRKESRI